MKGIIREIAALIHRAERDAGAAWVRRAVGVGEALGRHDHGLAPEQFLEMGEGLFRRDQIRPDDHAAVVIDRAVAGQRVRGAGFHAAKAALTAELRDFAELVGRVGLELRLGEHRAQADAGAVLLRNQAVVGADMPETGLDRREPQVEGAVEEDPGLGAFFFHAEVRDVAPARGGAREPARVFEIKREAVAGFVQEVLGDVFAEFHRADARVRRGRGEGDALGDDDHAVRHVEEVPGSAARLRFREILRRCDPREVGAQLAGDALYLLRINGFSGLGSVHGNPRVSGVGSVR